MNSQNRRRKTPQTRKEIIMKKSTINTIASVLASIDFENKSAILDELNAELNKGADKRAAKAAEYDAVRDTILGGLSDTPVTIAELYDSIKDELPDGFSRNKVQYAIVNLYKDEVEKISGSPNTYKRA